MRKGIISLIPIVIIFLLTAGAALYFAQTSLDISVPWSGACVQDAMQCPDGSFIGRTGPRCEFAACPDVVDSPPRGGSTGGDGSSGTSSGTTECISDSQCPSSQTCVALESVGTVEPGDGGSSFTVTRGECRMKIGGSCAGSSDCGEGICYLGVCTQPIGRLCAGGGDTSCGGAYECVQGCGPPVVRGDSAPPPYFCQLKGYQRPCPICLAENAAIATPAGEIVVQDLREGMTVWTADAAGARVAAGIIKVLRTPVPSTHRVVHLVLEDGRELLVSPGHPTADGRIMGDLKAGDMIDGSRVAAVELVSYGGGFTYDLLPAGDTGFYWADGILIGSTLLGD